MSKETDQNIKGKLERYLSYVRIDPKNDGLLRDAINLAMTCEDWECAGRLIEQGRIAWPDDPIFEIFADARAWKIQDLVELERSATCLCELCADEPEHHYHLAWCAMHKRDFERAVLQLTNHFAVHAEYCLLAMHCLHLAGKIDEAITLGERAIEMHGDAPKVAGQLAMLYLDAFDEIKARAYAQQCLDRLPDYPAAATTMATLAVSDGDFVGGLERFSKLATAHQKDGRIWSGYAAALLANGKLAEAETAFAHSVMYMPEHIGTWLTYGWTFLLQSNLDVAEQHFVRAMKIDDRFAETWASLAVVHAMRGDDRQAKHCREIAHRLNPDVNADRFLDFRDLVARGENDAARALVQETLRRVRQPRASAEKSGKSG